MNSESDSSQFPNLPALIATFNRVSLSRSRVSASVRSSASAARNAIIHGGVLNPGVNFLPKPFTADEPALKIREVLGPPRAPHRKA